MTNILFKVEFFYSNIFVRLSNVTLSGVEVGVEALCSSTNSSITFSPLFHH